MTRSERTSASEVRGLVHLARKELLRSVDADRDVPGMERLVRGQRRALAQRRKAPYVWGAAALAAAALALLAFRALPPRSPARLAFTVQGAASADRGQPSARYEFSDGTVISLRTGANLQVLSADELAPHVRLSHGEAAVRVVHRPSSQWDFSAGPFEVAVVGTAFDLKWDPDSQSFALDLQQGSVRITGPVLDGPLLMRAGHRVSIAVPSGRVAIDASPQPSEGAPSLPASAAGALPPAGPEARDLTRTSPSTQVSDTPSSPHALPKPTWRALVGRGRFAEVIAEAQAMSIEGCLSQCSSADLRSLGDAARYTGRAGLAERVFLGLRQRFPGSPDSTVAAFLLAHTYEAQHRLPLAATWYERYSSEAPSGEFSAEASAGRARVSAPH